MRRPRNRAAWVAAALLIGLAVKPGLPASASARPAGGAVPVSGQAQSANPLAESGQAKVLSPTSGQLPSNAKKVTLITGDVVSYAGRAHVQVRPAPRADGAPALFTTMTRNGDTYVIPADAMTAIASGRLDMSLFDVSYLIANGYADSATKQLPLIVRYQSAAPGSMSARSHALTQRAASLPGASAPLTFASMDGAAVKIGKARATALWALVGGHTAAGGHAAAGSLGALGGGLAHVWLDRKVHADLSANMTQIGAPAAWQAGYDGTGVKVAILDTGIDATHPDLAGKVAASANFTEDPSVQDGFGHGTHVAGILAGSGAASGGEYRGVAPGASLLIGKVLDSTGTGDNSQVMAGMQWAVSQGARVVSMSLGDNDFNDGTDPMSELVDSLSASSGALFVIAAGNSGSSPETVSAPGTADAALTVAAVDGSDATASFSSRGPREGDWALKPDISAPGVDIVAPRAAGTQLGPVVDGQYVTLSGTSMATPHVAGSAAILAEEHPDWTGQQIKDALISTAHDDGAPAWEQGSGRLDIGRAATQEVLASGNVDFGKLTYPQAGPVSKPLVYTNDSGMPVTLNLKATLTAYRGTPAAGELALAQDTVTVPAHGTATDEVTFDPGKGGDATYYSGEIQAADATGSVELSDAVGAFVEPKTATLSATVIPPAGATDVSDVGWFMYRVDNRDELDNSYNAVQPGLPTAQLTSYVGHWAAETLVLWRDAAGNRNVGMAIDPQIDVTGDTHVTLDLNKAVQATVEAPQPLQRWHGIIGVQRTTASGLVADMYGWVHYGEPSKFWMLPSQQVTDGKMREYEQYLLGPNRIEMTAPGLHGLTLHPLYYWYDTVKMLDGTMHLPLADAGDGTTAGLSGKDVTGKLALVNLADICPDLSNCDYSYYFATIAKRVANVAKAGATAFLGYGTDQLQFQGPSMLDYDGTTYPVPTIGVPAAEGQALAAVLSQHPVTMLIHGQANTPYVYALRFQTDGRIPAALSHRVGPDNLLTEVNRDHADGPATATHWWSVLQLDHTYTPTDLLQLNVRAPGGVTAYVGPVSHDVLFDSDVFLTYDVPDGAPVGESNGPIDTRLFYVTGPGQVTYDWAEGPLAPGTPRFSKPVLQAGWTACMACRAGDYYTPLFGLTHDGTATGILSWTPANGFPGDSVHQDVFHMYQDGTEVPQTNELYCPQGYCFFYLPAFKMTPGYAQYRLTEDYNSEFPMARYDDSIHTEWTFGSQRPAQSPSAFDVCAADWLLDLSKRSFVNPGANAPCESSSQLYLGYDLGLDLNNQLQAGTTSQATVTAYQSSLLSAAAPQVTSLKLWQTYDGGTTWVPVPTKAIGNGSYSATLVNPSATATGTVGLRAEATDAAGDTISQVIDDAYGLAGASQSNAEHHGARITQP